VFAAGAIGRRGAKDQVMSMFEREDYAWRETYFVLFDRAKRPTMNAVEKVLRHLPGRFELSHQTSDSDGLFEAATLISPSDYAALEIAFVEGEEVTEHAAGLIEEMKATAADAAERKKLAQLAHADARLDVMHFQNVDNDESDEDEDEMFDPAALLVVLEALAKLTGGVGIDPQSGCLM